MRFDRHSCTRVCRSPFRLATAVLLFVAAVAPSTGARAGDPEALIRGGVELRKAGHDQQALSLFQQAVAEKRTPRGLAQLAFCEQALGLWAVAERDLEDALKSQGDDAWKEKNAKALRESLAFVKTKLGSVEVWGRPDGATVTIDDDAAGTLPLRAPLRVSEGRRTFRVEAKGYVPETRTIDVRGATSVREHVALARTFSSTEVASAVPRAEKEPVDATPMVAMAAAPGVPRPDDEGRETSSPYYTRWWFWTAIAVGVVGAGAATFLVVRGNNHSDGCVPQSGAPCW